MKIYGIGGLGADERVFKNLKLSVPFEFIPWNTPLPNENLMDYSIRLSQKIDSKKPFCLLGVSFGGMIAQHISNALIPAHSFLISTATNRTQIPLPFRMAAKSDLFRVVPNRMLFPPSSSLPWLFGVTQEENKQLINQIVDETDPSFLRWALHQIALFQPTALHFEYTVIHGSDDRMILAPIKSSAHIIPDSGHLAIMEEAEPISEIINNLLKDKQIA